MAVVISSSLVLSAAVGDAPNANNPLIGWHNLAIVGNIIATSQDPSFPALNLANALTHLLWRSASTATQYITVTHNAVEPIDYVAIAGHNFGSGGIVVSVEGYSALDIDGDPVWEELVGEFAPGADTPILCRFPPRSLIGVRIKLQPSARAPIATVAYVGRLLVLQRRIYVDHKPLLFNERVDNSVGLSDRGQYLGDIVLSAWNEGAIQQANVTPDYYREHIEPWRRRGLMRRQPFFFAWRPGDYPQEVAYCWLPKGSTLDVSNQLPNGMMQFSLTVQGMVS